MGHSFASCGREFKVAAVSAVRADPVFGPLAVTEELKRLALAASPEAAKALLLQPPARALLTSADNLSA